MTKSINELNQKAAQGVAGLTAAEAQRKQTLETAYKQLEEEMKAHAEGMDKLKESLSRTSEDILESKEGLRDALEPLESELTAWETEAEQKARKRTFEKLEKNIKNTRKK